MDKNIINNKPKFGSNVYQGPEVLESNIGISVVQHQTECLESRKRMGASSDMRLVQRENR
eukprot:scaffold682_cov363-Pavlova_lutheri.AAC.43